MNILLEVSKMRAINDVYRNRKGNTDDKLMVVSSRYLESIDSLKGIDLKNIGFCEVMNLIRNISNKYNTTFPKHIFLFLHH